jgi:hypothetical protein
MNLPHEDKMPSQVQRQIRERAVQHFFPNSGLKPLRPGSVLYTNRQGLVAHVSTAQHSGGGDVRFWYGFRINHLASISKARQAFFVACGFIDDDRCKYFAFPCSANDRGVFICGRPLLSKTGESHFNVELTLSDGVFLLNLFDGGQPIDASPFQDRGS